MATETRGRGGARLDAAPGAQVHLRALDGGSQGERPVRRADAPGAHPSETVRKLADLGAYGVCFHDNDLILSAPSRMSASILTSFRKALDETGMKVSMATTNLFATLFKDGAFTSNDRDVRRFALQKTFRGIDLGAELGARSTCSGAAAWASRQAWCVTRSSAIARPSTSAVST